MKRLALAVALSVALSTGAYAQSTTDDPTAYPWEVSAQAGVLMPDGDGRIDEDKAYVTGRATYDLTPNVAFGGEIGNIYYKDQANGNKYGYIRGVPLMGTLVLKMPIEATDNRLVPYLLGGAGVIMWDYDRSSYADSVGIDVDNEREASWAAKLGGGVDYYMTPRTAIFAEASYLFSQYKPDIIAGGGIASEYDTNAAMIGAGLKFKI